jgi:energy-coupling factor transporter ATP-binding protein EcfA2
MTEIDSTQIDPSQIKNLIDIFKFGWELAKNTVEKARGAMIDEPKLQYAANNYLTKLLKLYGSTTILGKNKPVPLDDIFTDLFIWDKPQAMRRFSVEAMEEAHRQGRSHEGLQRHEGLDVVEKHEYLFILGKPGAGKTTFLKWVTTQVVQDQEWMPYLPIFVNLKELADSGRTLIQQLVIELETCQFKEDTETFLTKLLEAGRVMVLLDGLDEVQAETGRQEQVIDDIRAFVKKYDKSRYLMTCRVAAVNFVFDTFTYVEMSDFNDEQIDEYIERYFLEDEESGKSCKELLHQPAQEKLRELARSPILLSLLCLNYEETRTFPTRRVELYEEALDALLKKWDNTRKIRRDEPYKEMSLGRKKQLYAHLAYHNFIKGTYFIPSGRLEEQIESYVSAMPGITVSEVEGEKLLRAMGAQHGILVERAKQIYAFAHLTFQEYYTAKYIVENASIGTLDELIKHIGDYRWREVALLTVSLMSNADVFFEKSLDALAQNLRVHVIDCQILKFVHRRPERYSLIPLVDRSLKLYFLLTTYIINTCNKITEYAPDITPEFINSFLYGVDNVEFVKTDLSIILYNMLNLDSSSITSQLQLSLNLSNTFRRFSITVEHLELAHSFDLASTLARARAYLISLLYSWHRSYGIMNTKYFLLDTFLTSLILNTKEIVLRESLLHHAYDMASSVGETKLAEKLLKLFDSLSESSHLQQSQFYLDITEILKTHRKLYLNDSLQIPNVSALDEYIDEIIFLLQCLDLAIVSDREGIRARLLMPPVE